MRWKLLFIVSIAAGFIACALWSGLVIGLFGSARALGRNDWFLVSSALVPLAVAMCAGVFVYRHTARRRKTQALITAVSALFFTAGIYLIASQVFPDKLIIPRPYEVRHAR